MIRCSRLQLVGKVKGHVSVMCLVMNPTPQLRCSRYIVNRDRQLPWFSQLGPQVLREHTRFHAHLLPWAPCQKQRLLLLWVGWTASNCWTTISAHLYLLIICGNLHKLHNPPPAPGLLDLCESRVCYIFFSRSSDSSSLDNASGEDVTRGITCWKRLRATAGTFCIFCGFQINLHCPMIGHLEINVQLLVMGFM